MKRVIHFSPAHQITKSGTVWKGRDKIVPIAKQGRFGLQHLHVKIDDDFQRVSKLLSVFWYQSSMILTRDGGVLNWTEDNVFTLRKLTCSKFEGKYDEIQYIWYLYQHDRVPCYRMSERSNLLEFHVDDFKTLITDILVASVR